MSTSRDFQRALARAWADAGGGGDVLPGAIATGALAVLPADGVSISVVTANDQRLPLGASSDAAALAESLEFTVGHGPCLEACQHGIVIDAPMALLVRRWAALSELWFARTPFRSAISLPLQLGVSTLGALNVFFTHERGGYDVDLHGAQMVTALARNELDWWISGREERAVEVTSGLLARARDQVWVAVGMLVEHGGLTAADALDLLRAWSYSHAQTVDQSAVDLVTGRVDIGAVLP